MGNSIQKTTHFVTESMEDVAADTISLEALTHRDKSSANSSKNMENPIQQQAAKPSQNDSIHVCIGRLPNATSTIQMLWVRLRVYLEVDT